MRDKTKFIHGLFIQMLQYLDFVGEKVFCLSKHHCICSKLSTYRFFFSYVYVRKKNCTVDQLSFKEINVHVLNLFSNKTLVHWIIWANVLALDFTLLNCYIFWFFSTVDFLFNMSTEFCNSTSCSKLQEYKIPNAYFYHNFIQFTSVRKIKAILKSLSCASCNFIGYKFPALN